MMVMATCNWQTMPPQGWLTRAEQRSLELMQNGHVTEQVSTKSVSHTLAFCH